MSAQPIATIGFSGATVEGPGLEAGLQFGRAITDAVTIETTTFASTSQKRTGGYKLGETVLVRARAVMLGLDYRYRDGGEWNKQVVWAVAGWSWRKPDAEWRVLARVPIYESAPNHVHQFAFEHRAQRRSSRFGVMGTAGLIAFTDVRPDAPLRLGGFGSVALTVRLNRVE